MTNDENLQAELDRLRAENESLRASLDGETRSSGNLRGVIVWVLIVVGCLSAAAASVGLWARTTALDTETRRRRERELIPYYLEQLRARGVPDVPSLDDAWLLYRQTALWGFLIGWMITPIENYGEEILQANLDRLTAALEDLETFDALPD